MQIAAAHEAINQPSPQAQIELAMAIAPQVELNTQATIEENNGSLQWLENITEHFAIKNFIPEAANFLSIFGNAASALANIFDWSDSVKSFADGFGKFGTKAFLVLNGAINVLEYLLKCDLLGALGHFNDVIIGLTAEHDHIYLDRGSASGTYTLANSLSIIQGNDNFKSPGHHWGQSLDALKKSYKNIFTKDFFKNLANSDNEMLGVLAGIFCNLGTFTWLTTGKEKLSTIIRDFGGIMIDLEQAHPGHFKNGKKFYFASGIGLIGGTVCDFLAKMLPLYRKAFVPLSLCIDGIGRYLLRMSHNRGELSKAVATS